MKHTALLLVMISLFWGCKEDGTPPPAAMADNVRGLLTQSIEGIIIPGEDGGTLYTCETAEPMVFVDPKGMLKKSLGDSLVYGSLLSGQLEFAVAKDGEAFQLKAVEYITGQWHRAGCLMIQHLQGLGNEPGWELRLDPPHEFVLRTNYGADEVTFPYVLPATAEGTWTYEVSMGMGEDADQLKIEVTDHPCQDNMAGTGFSYSMKVTHNGEVYSGCGRELSEAPQVQ